MPLVRFLDKYSSYSAEVDSHINAPLLRSIKSLLIPSNLGFPHGLQPNRSLVLWPYTDWADPRLSFGQTELRVAGDPRAEACKIGYFNRQGWIEYRYADGLRLRKRFEVQADLPHPDLGCNVEVYVRDAFIELETLGPLIELAPGESTEHEEVWEIEYPSTSFSSVMPLRMQ